MHSRIRHRNFSILSIAFLALGMFSSLSASAATIPLHFIQSLYDNIGLGEAISVAVSPDGKHVYVASCEEDSVVVFSRSSLDGSISLVQIIRDGSGGVDGLNGAWSIAISPIGNHVYVAGRYANAVAVFSRNSGTGALTFLEVEKQGVGGVDGISHAAGVGLDPDGEYVYVAGWNSDAIAWFKRNTSNGYLSWQGMVKDGVDADGIDGVWSVAVSPDGEDLYAVGGNEDSLAVFSRNPATGALTYLEHHKDGVGEVDGLDVAMSVTVAPDGKDVYATGRDDEAIAVFSRSTSTGLLTFVEAEREEGEGETGRLQDVKVSFDSNHVYVAGMYGAYGYDRDLVSGELTYSGRVLYTDPGVTGLYDASGIALSYDDDNVYVAARNNNAVAVLNRDNSTGDLTFNQAQEGIDGLDGALGMAISPDGNFLYATGSVDNSVVALKRNSNTGKIDSTRYIRRDGDPGVDGLAGARSIVVSPDGLHVYVVGYDDDAVAAFRRDADEGYLVYIEMEKDGVDTVDGLLGPQGITISPDGKHVYVASYDDGAVVVFSRNAGTGELTYVENEKDGVCCDGLDGAYSVVVSPDGNHVYVVGISDNAIVMFTRQSSTGELTWDSTYQDDVDIVQGMVGANDVVISPDGNHIYVASRTDDAIAYFLRNPSNGRLLFITAYYDTNPGLDGLDGARALAMSPDGSYLYVASQYEDAVAAFQRDATTGLLTYLGMVKDGVDGVNSLNTADGIVVSPDGFNVYAAAYGDDAVTVFLRFSIFLPLVEKY